MATTYPIAAIEREVHPMIDSFPDAATWGLAPSPTRFLAVVETSVRARGELALAQARRGTMTELAATLCESGQPATVTARERDGVEWTITVGSRSEMPLR